MPIVERTPRACFDRFAAHVRPLVAKTLCPRRHVALETVRGTTRATLTFAEADGTAAALDTPAGKLYFYASQRLDAVSEGKGRFRLVTLGYWYRLQSGSELTAQNALLRWEYARDIGKHRHCRHHVHAPLTMPLPGGKLDLDKAHVPTGWVTIEEVIRFLIVDIGHAPPCGNAWPEALSASERAFYEEFTSKRYKAPK